MLLMMGPGMGKMHLDETSGEVTVGVCINQNDFGLKVIDDGEEEDVTKLVK